MSVMPTSADSAGGPNEQPLKVRYYPRRVRGGRSGDPLTPSQALHLATDPSRAALAARTSERRDLVVTAPAPANRFRAWVARLFSR